MLGWMVDEQGWVHSFFKFNACGVRVLCKLSLLPLTQPCRLNGRSMRRGDHERDTEAFGNAESKTRTVSVAHAIIVCILHDAMASLIAALWSSPQILI